MEELLPLARRIAERLKARGETIAVAESSTGGLISAVLLSVPGASAYFLGGSVIYTRKAGAALLGLPAPLPGGMRASTEEYARLLAATVRERFGANWGLGETGATGPTGNRYGDPAGHCCFAVNNGTAESRMLRTGSADREPNMRAFARAALELLASRLEQG